MRERVSAALRLGEPLGATYILTGGPTGGPTDDIGRHGPAEAEVMAALLQTQGVTPNRIRLEPTARNTIASVRACAALLQGFPGPIYAATSAYHLPRCVVLLRLAGLHALPCPPPRRPASASIRRRWWWRLREIPALPLDAALLAWLRLRGQIQLPP